MGRDAVGPGKALEDMRGAGIVEALLALLLFATATLGTLSAFTGATRGDHSALLRTQAVGLAADAAEQLRARLPGAPWDAAAWQREALAVLPGQGRRTTLPSAQLAVAEASGAGYRLRLRWVDPADGAAVQLEQQVDLPAADPP